MPSGRRLRVDRRLAFGLAVPVALALQLLHAGAFGGGGAALAAAEERRAVILGLQRPEQRLARVAGRVSRPGSPSYGRYLSLVALRRGFGAPPATRRRVLRFLRAAPGVGFVRVGPTGAVALATMTPAAAQRLFCARGQRPPRRGLCRPRALRSAVRQVVAGQVYAAPRRAPRRRGEASSGTPRGCAAALESKAFTPNQIATAYGVDGLAAAGLDGSGIRVATMSPALVDPAPLAEWARCFGQPALRFHQTAMPGGGRQTSTAAEETYLDAEALAALAPRLQRITAVNVPQDAAFQSSFALFMLGALDPARQGGRLPDVLSISDGACESSVSRGEMAIGQHLLRAAAALGITALSASGDLGFLGCESGSGASWPASSRYVTADGGTDISLDPANRLTDETVWSTFASEGRNGTGSGGGPSDIWARPGWQRAPGVGPELQRGEPTRLTPDLAAMASFTPGLATNGGFGGWGGSGGTSAATPIVAAIVALVAQREAAAGRPPLGALNPLLYRIARGPLREAAYRDVTEGTSSPRPRTRLGMSPAGGAAQPGYDLATGLGSPYAVGFAAAVAAVRGAG